MMMNPKKVKNWSDLELEQYVLGELDEATQVELRLCLQSDEQLRQRLESLKQSDQDILKQYTPEYISQQVAYKRKQQKPQGAKIEARLQSNPANSWFNRLSYALPLLLVAGFVFMIALQQNDLSISGGNGLVVDGVPLERTKGGEPVLRVYRKTSDGQEQLGDSAVASQGDLIQLQYVAAGNVYGLIFSIDGNGTITPHLDKNGNSVKLTQGEAISLGHAYELDDAPGFENFYFVTAEEGFKLSSLDLETQIPALLKDPQHPIVLPEEYNQTVFSLKKD